MNTHQGGIVHIGLALAVLASTSSFIHRARADVFFDTGSLTSARYYYTATCLPDGKVLVAGGQGTGGYLSSAELYDPADGKWKILLTGEVGGGTGVDFMVLTE